MLCCSAIWCAARPQRAGGNRTLGGSVHDAGSIASAGPTKGPGAWFTGAKLARNQRARFDGKRAGSEFVSDVPGEDHRAVRLVGKQPGFIHHRYLSSRKVLADFE